ncbi:type 2 lanthipeptide synthetase LanM family protein [Paraclostridium sordellii]|uniref:type 2 lanthipeptide synthetase LanM family protein n=1 Tax=Paraclostridium sordellii TaxID=1505 RepID=UPI00189C3F0E|nr:type 2 lanthipeptide synthetase LanM family protein [Paeniclostridium sordellii]
MNKVIEKARTIEEKRKGYSKESVIDYSYFKEWRNVRTLLNDKYLEVMLKEMNLSREEFSYVLQPISGIVATVEDEWNNEFKEIIDSFDYEKIDYSVGVNLPTLPFSKYLACEIKKVANQLKEVKVKEEVIDSFIEAHLIEMFNIMGRITALKLEEYKQTHRFISKDNKIRFEEFLKSTFYSKESFLKLFEEYPVAARVATVRTMYLKKNFCKILQNIENDHQEIKKFLMIDFLNLTEIKLSNGDSHHQGNSVSILEFQDKRLVYKPKNLKICKSFEKFIDWYTNSSELLPISIPKGIYKDEYTYNEFIMPKFCQNEKEVENFYIRYGYLIALCYLLNLNDLHLENIIAHGEYPVIIDIETCFQASVEMENNSIYVDLLRYLEVDSVSNSFLLPKQISVGSDDDIELSALSGREVKLSKTFLAPTEVNTDNFHYENIPGYFAGADNIPKLSDNEEVEVKKYRLKILEGFDDFISFIMENKNECLDILEVFKGQKIRLLTKGTEKYASMIRYASHPNYNREMKYRERLMMNLWAYPYLDKRIIKSEVNDLLFNDIPIFYSYTDSKNLIDSKGNVYKDFHKSSGFELSINKIKGLTEKEIRMQLNIILNELGVSDYYLNQKVTKRELNFNVQKFDYLKQAKKIANRLINDAFIKGDKCSFISVDCNEKNKWKFIPSDESFYSGLSGISVLFLELYIKTGEKIYFKYYQMLIHTAIEQTKNTGFESAFTGWLSPIYPLILEYKYLNTISDDEFLKFTIKKLESLKIDDIKKASKSDYISGISGIIRLLSLIQMTFGDNYISEDVIKIFSKALLDKLESGQEKAIENVGIAHGISGIMLGLGSSGIVDPEFIKTYLLKESQMKIPKKDTYKWCWGLSGMIQARLQLLKINHLNVDKKQLEELIEKFEKSISLMLNEDSLCHGNGSIITTLKMIYEYTNQEKWKSLLQLWMSNLNMNSLFDCYKISKIGDIQTKGIFDGISGMGWIYLYASSPISNLLLLETK